MHLGLHCDAIYFWVELFLFLIHLWHKWLVIKLLSGRSTADDMPRQWAALLWQYLSTPQQYSPSMQPGCHLWCINVFYESVVHALQRVSYIQSSLNVPCQSPNLTGCFRIGVRTDTAELSDMRIQHWNLAQKLKFKTDFHSKMSERIDMNWGWTPNPRQFQHWVWMS